jgi:hypothetical protein
LPLGIACRVWTRTARRLLSRCRTPANHGSEDPQHVEMLASRRDGSTAIEGRDGRARGWGRGRSNGSPTRPPRRAPGDAGAVLRTKDANQHHGGAGGSEPRDDGSMPATEEHAWEVDRTIVRRARPTAARHGQDPTTAASEIHLSFPGVLSLVRALYRSKPTLHKIIRSMQ